MTSTEMARSQAERMSVKHFYQTAPEVVEALRNLSGAATRAGLSQQLIELVKVRASQINGCAYCVNMHAEEARAAGETETRLQLICVWHEAGVFTPREQAALAWTEALTLITERHVPDAVYEIAAQHFDQVELAYLTAAIVAINSWNRIAIAFRSTPDLKAR